MSSAWGCPDVVLAGRGHRVTVCTRPAAARLAGSLGPGVHRRQRRAQPRGFPVPRGGAATRIAGLVERIVNGHEAGRSK